MQNRRNFLSQAGLAVAATALAPTLAHAAPEANGKFIHHVYFWLNNPDSTADRDKLLEGLRTLTKIKDIQTHHIGIPADTAREVIDRSYAVSWLLIFENKAAQDRYQVHPVHLAFVEKYSHLWKKVVVYDSVDA